MDVPRPAIDREQIKQALCSVDGPLMMRSADVRAVVMESQYGKSADAVLALLNGSGVDSSLHTCPGCGVKVVGHERCGDPTRPECASRPALVVSGKREDAAHPGHGDGQR